MPRKKVKVARTKEGLKIPSIAKKCLSFDETGNELWEIENILDQRKVNGEMEYLVKWTNWTYKYCTWEPEESFLEDMDIILEFVKEKNEGIRRVYTLTGNEKKTKKKNKAKKKTKTTSEESKTNSKSRSRTRTRSMSKGKGRGRPKMLGSKLMSNKSRSRSRFRSTTKPKEPREPPPTSKRGPGRPPKIRRGRPGRPKREPKEEEPECCDETKIVIQKLTVPSTASVFQMNGTNNVIISHNNEFSSPPGSTQKMTDVFFCRCSDDTSGTNQSDEKPKSRRKTSKNGKQAFKDFFDEDDSEHGMEEEEEEEDSEANSEVKSHRSDFSVPLLENELEKIIDFKVVVEECFTFATSNLTQPSSFKFKVAFYDDDNNLKGYDYFSYDEIKQKKWDNELLSFYAQELLTEMVESGTSITPNIKII